MDAEASEVQILFLVVDTKALRPPESNKLPMDGLYHAQTV